MRKQMMAGPRVVLAGAGLLFAQACTPVPRAHSTYTAYASGYAYPYRNQYRPPYAYSYRPPAVPQRAHTTSTASAPVTEDSPSTGQVLVGIALAGVAVCILTDCLSTSGDPGSSRTHTDSTTRDYIEKQKQERKADKLFDMHQADWINKNYGSP